MPAPPSSRGTVRRQTLEEIALEGLDGVTLPSLWVYLAASLNVPQLMETEKNDVWKVILELRNHLSCYELPEERETVKLYYRFDNLDEDYGVPIATDECKFPRYKMVPVTGGGTWGSCEHYYTRKNIPFETLELMSVDEVLNKWGKKFVIVASQKQRWTILTPPNVPIPEDELTPIQYCILEAIGRARFNGETTAGKWSLLNFCKDPTMVFYIKNKLLSHKLIMSRSINEKVGGRLFPCSLIFLHRFFTIKRSVLDNVIEKVFHVLKETPGHRKTMVELRDLFPAMEGKKTFRKITLTHDFKEVFETKSLPYTEVFKKTAKCAQPPQKSKMVLVVELKDPNSTPQSLLNHEEGGTEDSWHTDEDFHVGKEALVDLDILRQIYRLIAKYGKRGCAQSDIQNDLAMERLEVRYIVGRLEADGLLFSYPIDEGRQRIIMYVAYEHGTTIKAAKEETRDILKNLRCAEEPNIPKPDNDAPLSDVPVISASIRTFNCGNITTINEQTATKRQMERKNIIIQMIDAKCIVSFIDIRNHIQNVERKSGFKGDACRKSIRRLLSQMNNEHLLNMYEITLFYEENGRVYRYVTHPKIDIGHEVLQREMLQLKNNLFLCVEETRLRKRVSAHSKKRLAIKRSSKPDRLSADKKTNNSVDMRLNKPPKFLVSRYIHEFLFYVVNLEKSSVGSPITEDLLYEWQLAEPALEIKGFLKQLATEKTQPIAYTKLISWRTFIPPLPQYTEKPPGWVYFMDAIERIPLSVFNKIFRIEKNGDEQLYSFLSHPIRQHYLVSQLPLDMRTYISHIQMQRIMMVGLKLLNNMGLVQVSERLNPKDPLIMWVYLNRRATILDTTTTEASYEHVNPKRHYEPTSYTFSAFDDVQQYWMNLHRVCTYTKLGFRKASSDRVGACKTMEFWRTVDFQEAPQLDTGQTPGDGQGAAGLAKKLFAHTFRNWSWVLHTNSIPKVKRKGRIAKTDAERNKISKSTVILRRKGKSAVPVRRIVGNNTVERRARVKRQIVRDAIDRDALKNMRTLRVTWSKEEDELLKMARATYLYISAPALALELFTVGRIVRDVIRRHLGIRNKTTQASVRRMQFLIKKQRHLPAVPTWVHALQTHPELKRRYGENFAVNLKKVYSNRQEYSAAMSVHFILIMNFLYNYVARKTLVPQFTIPNTIAEFYRKFDVRSNVSDDDPTLYYTNPSSEFDLQVFVVYCVLHSALCSTRDKSAYNLQAFEIYKNYSEEVLNAAFAKARGDGLVVAIKRKNIQSIPSQLAGPAFLLSSRYRLRLTYLKIPYSFYDSFYCCFETALKALFGAHSSREAKQCLELKSPNTGQLFVIAEGLTQDFWQLSVQLPSSILTVDSEQRQGVERILDHYSTIFDNAPETEYIKNLEGEAVEKQVRVRFHPASLRYKIYYVPYDYISKLPTRYLHFFCALDHLNNEVEINFSKLRRKQTDDSDSIMTEECPFNCIMLKNNYINEIERIVQEKKSMLKKLSEPAPQQLLNTATAGCTVTVLPTNLLTLVRMLESFWREKETANDRKDLGKLPPTLKSAKSVNWNELCNEILEFSSNGEEDEKHEEYEPMLSKDERARGNDVFVVNLPTLGISASEKLCRNTDTVLENDIKVPLCLLEAQVQRADILQKVIREAFWKYTENTLETLKPELKQLNFDENDNKYLAQVHDFIEEHGVFGVAALELLRKFPNEKLLIRCLHTLSEHSLIKRVGVATITYVHKTHIRQWMVHSFHMKRLQHEKLGLKNTNRKRKYDSMEDSNGASLDADDTDAASSSKRATLDKGNAVIMDTKRKPKPVERYRNENYDNFQMTQTEVTREVIVMKPKPWIRLNGSLNRRVLDRWLGCVLTECISRTGCFVHGICTRFPHMPPVDIMFLLEILNDLKCLHLVEIRKPKVGPFSSYENIQESIVTEFYDPEFTYIKTHADAVIRMATFIGNKKYNAEFI